MDADTTAGGRFRRDEGTSAATEPSTASGGPTDDAGAGLVTRRAFDRSAVSVAQARLFVAAALADGGLVSPVVDLALVAVSEMATNAVNHARTGFEVAVDTGRSVRITVTDASNQLPELHHFNLWGERGRGVAFLDATAHRWGVEREGEGKRVWWEVDLPLP